MDAVLKLNWMQKNRWGKVIGELQHDFEAGRMLVTEDVGMLELASSRGMIRYITPDDEIEPTPPEGWEKRIERILSEIEAGRCEAEAEPEALSFSTNAGILVFAGRDGEVI